MSYWDRDDIDEMYELHLKNNLNKITEECMTTVAQAELQEANDIVRLLDETMLFDSASVEGNDKFIGKPGLALSVIIHLLVSKGVLSLQDVQRFLNVEKDK